nr:hypothetical protein [Nannocystis pusilla]
MWHTSSTGAIAVPSASAKRRAIRARFACAHATAPSCARRYARVLAGAVQPGRREAVDVGAQDRLAEPARAAVDQQHQRACRDPQRRPRLRVLDRVDLLQLREVVAAADRPERRVVVGRRDCPFGQELARIAFPRPVEVAEAVGPALELLPALRQLGGPQRHPAADVVADQVRVDPPLADERRPDRRALARVEVGHADRRDHPRQRRRALELLHRLALDPRLRRRHDPHRRPVLRIHPCTSAWRLQRPQVSVVRRRAAAKRRPPSRALVVRAHHRTPGGSRRSSRLPICRFAVA